MIRQRRRYKHTHTHGSQAEREGKGNSASIQYQWFPAGRGRRDQVRRLHCRRYPHRLGPPASAAHPRSRRSYAAMKSINQSYNQPTNRPSPTLIASLNSCVCSLAASCSVPPAAARCSTLSLSHRSADSFSPNSLQTQVTTSRSIIQNNRPIKQSIVLDFSAGGERESGQHVALLQELLQCLVPSLNRQQV